MCPPLIIPLLLVATTAISAGLTFAAQSAAASSQNQQAVRVAQSADTSYRVQQQQIQEHLGAQRDALVQQDSNQAIDAERLRASERVSSAEAGVSGVSLDAILSQTDREQANASAVNQKNLGVAQLDAVHQERNAYYQALDRRNSVPFGQYPNLLTPILQTAGAALSVGSQYYKPNLASSQIGGSPSQIGGYESYSHQV